MRYIQLMQTTRFVVFQLANSSDPGVLYTDTPIRRFPQHVLIVGSSHVTFAVKTF